VKVPSNGEKRVESLLGYSIENDVAALQLPSVATVSDRPPLGPPPGTVDEALRQADAETKRRNREYFASVADRLAQTSGRQTDPQTKASQPSEVGSSYPRLRTEESPQVRVGDHVVAIGAPLGLENTVSEGIVSALRDITGTHVIQTTASISPGSSGGPLLNDYGRVIGLTTSTVRNGQNLNFVIASSHISDLLMQRHQLSLEQMLTETLVSDPFPQSTIPVPARSLNSLRFAVTGQQGAVLQGTYTIAGGAGNDVGVALLGPGNVVLVNSGRVSGYGQFSQRLPMGQYVIVFDNRFSTFSGKSVSPDLKLTYYR
jgi:hypothetical protein